MMRSGRNLHIGESRVDRRTACLNHADAFREKAIADPAHHDEWIDEAIKWLEYAMEAGRRVAVTFEARDGLPVQDQPEQAATDALSSQPSERSA